MTPSMEAALSRYERRGSELAIGGKTVSQWTGDSGSPLYVYDRALLRRKREELRAAMPSDLALTYAVKANPNVDVIRAMGELYDGVDIASGGELERALEAGIAPGRMSFAGPGKSLAELRLAVESGVGTVSVESEREVEHLDALAREAGKKARLLIRVNPAFELARSGLKMGGGPKQFGIDSERVPALIAAMRDHPRLEFKGLHIFSGTQNLSAESLLTAFERILAYGGELARETGVPLETFNLGGGLGIPYFKGDMPLDLAAVGSGLADLLAKARAALPATHFKLELGRFLVGEAGLYLSRVRYRKESRGEIFLVLDGGMHHHLPASGNISLNPIKRPMQIITANRLDAPWEKVNVVGPLCTPLDTFGMGVEMPRADEGDVIAVLNAGAYGYSISPLGFLSHPLPGEVLA